MRASGSRRTRRNRAKERTVGAQARVHVVRDNGASVQYRRELLLPLRARELLDLALQLSHRLPEFIELGVKLFDDLRGHTRLTTQLLPQPLLSSLGDLLCEVGKTRGMEVLDGLAEVLPASFRLLTISKRALRTFAARANSRAR